jgi:uncharacterized membrane protein
VELAHPLTRRLTRRGPRSLDLERREPVASGPPRGRRGPVDARAGRAARRWETGQLDLPLPAEVSVGEARRVMTVRRLARVVLAVAMVAVGVLHFTDPVPFVRIVPPWLPAPLWLVWISGVAEIGLGAILLAPGERARWVARWGLIALYVAVFPANVHMAVDGVQLDPADPMPAWIAWARLPLQLVFIAWAWWVTDRAKDASPPASPVPPGSSPRG